ncbi:hypothetical protein ACFUEN_05280 [Streptomyces griseorubiginosus]|uniref:hypothetical protein n=1 Tax=Streptomyces griseorubiginosus TaxID=67304 RepID=UPI0036458417
MPFPQAQDQPFAFDGLPAAAADVTGVIVRGPDSAAAPTESPPTSPAATPTQGVINRERSAAPLDVLASQNSTGIALHDTDVAIVQTSASSGVTGGSGVPIANQADDVVSWDGAKAVEPVLRPVPEAGTAAVDGERRVRLRHGPAPRRGLSPYVFRLQDSQVNPTGRR